MANVLKTSVGSMPEAQDIVARFDQEPSQVPMRSERAQVLADTIRGILSLDPLTTLGIVEPGVSTIILTNNPRNSDATLPRVLITPSQEIDGAAIYRANEEAAKLAGGNC